jgi:hypothetical protein
MKEAKWLMRRRMSCPPPFSKPTTLLWLKTGQHMKNTRLLALANMNKSCLRELRS